MSTVSPVRAAFDPLRAQLLAQDSVKPNRELMAKLMALGVAVEANEYQRDAAAKLLQPIFGLEHKSPNYDERNILQRAEQLADMTIKGGESSRGFLLDMLVNHLKLPHINEGLRNFQSQLQQALGLEVPSNKQASLADCTTGDLRGALFQ